MKIPILMIILIEISIQLNAQEPIPTKEFADAIEDNSFFIEESYNQEERVVQHISNAYYRSGPTKDVMYSFTQEWPLFKYKQQVSYTIPLSFVDRNSMRGIGDILINYRYQIFYKENWACFSPRLSLILPTGDYHKGLGSGVTGVQVNLPVSKRISDYWVVHLNAGCTILPKAKNMTAENGMVKKTLTYYNLGGSVIWLTSTVFNFMFEWVETFNTSLDMNGILEHNAETTINPGIRGAINLGSLQIVPGCSFPVFISNKKADTGFLIYLSFEHPY
jgi:hypothetical protein